MPTTAGAPRQMMDHLSIAVYDRATPDILRTTGPYLQDYLQPCGKSQNGLDILLTCDTSIRLHVSWEVVGLVGFRRGLSGASNVTLDVPARWDCSRQGRNLTISGDDGERKNWRHRISILFSIHKTSDSEPMIRRPSKFAIKAESMALRIPTGHRLFLR
jgi:hypothetical protein